jgi:uncharacterized protein YndB with AHSA1/START domain
MSVKKEASGRRSIAVEVEVPGTPEQVWQAIATGPGVSSWFVPTEIRDDGTVVSHFGPGMDAVAKTTVWDPPRRFAAESPNLGPDAPKMATEWIVEGRSGGTCIVRVVHSLFASTDDWDKELESVESGWPGFFRVLKLYLTHFAGQSCAAIQLLGFAPGPAPSAWDALTRSLGLTDAQAGERRAAAAGAPLFGGIIEAAGDGKHPHVLLVRLDDPAAGILNLGAHSMGDQVFVSANLYFYGDHAADVVARDEQIWQTWMSERFPAGAVPNACV